MVAESESHHFAPSPVCLGHVGVSGTEKFLDSDAVFDGYIVLDTHRNDFTTWFEPGALFADGLSHREPWQSDKNGAWPPGAQPRANFNYDHGNRRRPRRGRGKRSRI